jgi:two-component system, NarL family, sensor kinase
MTRRRTSVTAAVTRFGLAGLLAVTALGALILFGVSRVSTQEALRSAQDRARLAGRGIVEPALLTALLKPETNDAINARLVLDDLVLSRVLSERVLRVKLWTDDGRILYSDEARLVGKRFPPKEDHQDAIRTGLTHTEEASTKGPENEFERDSGRLLEVYMPVRTPDGTPLVYEQYERYDSVVGNANRLVRQLAIPLLLGLALLWLTQLPLARSLARRVRSAEAETVQLLEHAVTASSRERERIAADLHDGLVQDLAALTFELSAASANASPGPVRETFDRTAGIARTTMRTLRSTLIDLHPPAINALGLGTGISALVQPLRESGIDVDVDLELDGIEPDHSALLYRIAQELLRNVSEHARATAVAVTGSQTKQSIRLVVTDNGIGFSTTTRAEQRASGHLGLELQTALAKRLGGTLTIDSQPGLGTVATLEVRR